MAAAPIDKYADADADADGPVETWLSSVCRESHVQVPAVVYTGPRETGSLTSLLQHSRNARIINPGEPESVMCDGAWGGAGLRWNEASMPSREEARAG